MSDAALERETSLGDGRRVLLRWIRPSDEALLRAGFERLSPASRHARFHTSMKELSGELLHALTHVDGVDHCAIVAVDGERLLGVARFVRTPDDPHSAELAITLADEVQGLGLASRLVAPLAEAARERGIEAFIGYVLGDNQRARRLLRKLGGEWIRSEHGLATYRIGLGRLVRESTAHAA